MPSPASAGFPRAVLALLLAAALLPGCPSKEPADAGASPAGGGAPAKAPQEAKPAVDPAVKAALAARPDLAKNRVLVLGLDGCDPVLVKEGVAAGRLPNFKRLIAEGAWGPLQSQQPMLSPLLWTSVATGMFPTEHGVVDFMVGSSQDPEKREAVTSRHRQVDAIWDIAGRYGRPVSVIGWLASHPAEEVNGVAVSERTELLAYLFNQKIAPSDEGKTWPPDLLAKIQPLRRRPADLPFAEVKPFLAISEEEYRLVCRKDEFTNDNRTNNLRLMLAGADNFRRIGTSLRRDRKPALDCRYFELLDAVGHNFMCYREPITWKPRELKEVQDCYRAADPPTSPADVETIWKAVREPAAEARPLSVQGVDPQRVAEILELCRGAEPAKVAKWKGVVDAAYDWTDRLLGEVMAEADADTILVVLSDHGFVSGDGKPPFDSSFNSKRGGAAYHRMYGVLGLWGRGVRKGFEIPPYAKNVARGARLVDIAPTVLALMGFPKAKDMPGRVLTEIFDLDLAVGETESYESGRAARLARQRVDVAGGKGTGGADATEESEIEDVTRRLTAVGYLGTAEEGPIRALLHMAASYEEQGRFAEAEEALREALKSARGPQRRQVWAGIGRTLFRQGNVDGAMRVFEDSLREAPQDPLLAWMGMVKVHAQKRNLAAQVDLWEKITAKYPEAAYRVMLADVLRQRAATGGPNSLADRARALSLILDSVRPEGGGEPDLGKLGPFGRNYLGMVLLDGGDFEGAMRNFKAAAEKEPQFVNPRNNLAVLHMRLASGAQSAADPESDPARRAALERQGGAHRAEALRWFGEVLEIDPENAKAHCNRAEVYLRLSPEDPKAAEADLLKALDTDPNYKRAKALLDELRAGKPKAPPAPRKVPR
jgi:tetratricopeptide (TPR) repeat protein